MGGHLIYRDLDLGAAHDRAMQRAVFDPIGMTSTTFDYDRTMAANFADAHSSDPDGESQADKDLAADAERYCEGIAAERNRLRVRCRLR